MKNNIVHFIEHLLLKQFMKNWYVVITVEMFAKALTFQASVLHSDETLMSKMSESAFSNTFTNDYNIPIRHPWEHKCSSFYIVVLVITL